MRCSISWICLFPLVLMGCSTSLKKEAKIYSIGEKVTIGSLTYSVVDTEIVPQLGDDPATARNPANRFYLIKVSVSNSSNADLPIPAMTLMDDSGQAYNELADGAKVPQWLGVVRKVAAAQTDQGNVVFDAPAKHYRLRLTDETDETEVAIDVPLSYVHEQMKDLKTVPDALPDQITIPNK
jgi:hypothetical protein